MKFSRGRISEEDTHVTPGAHVHFSISHFKPAVHSAHPFANDARAPYEREKTFFFRPRAIFHSRAVLPHLLRRARPRRFIASHPHAAVLSVYVYVHLIAVCAVGKEQSTGGTRLRAHVLSLSFLPSPWCASEKRERERVRTGASGRARYLMDKIYGGTPASIAERIYLAPRSAASIAS